MDDVKRLSRATRVVAFSLHPLCGCRFGALCETCRALCDIGRNFVHYLHQKKDLSVKILEGLDEEELCTLIESPYHFPSLEAIALHCDMWFLWPKSKRATERLSNLVFLSIRTREVGFEVKMPLDFPRLRSLEFFIKGGNSVRVWNWKLPILTTLVLKLTNYVIEGMIEEIHDTAPNLKFLSLPDEGEFNVEEPSRICSFTSSDSSPLAVNVGGRILEKVWACVKRWENYRALMGRFKWIEEFECVHFEKPLELDDETRGPFRRSSERLRGGLELKKMGVRYEDRRGLSFEEACDKFGGATPIASVKSFIDAVASE